MRECRHPNIVLFIGLCHAPHPDGRIFVSRPKAREILLQRVERRGDSRSCRNISLAETCADTFKTSEQSRFRGG